MTVKGDNWEPFEDDNEYEQGYVEEPRAKPAYEMPVIKMRETSSEDLRRRGSKKFRTIRAKERREAEISGEDTFYNNCPTHGVVLILTKLGFCQACWDAAAPRPPVVRARMLKAYRYLDRCDIHGETLHDGRYYSCQQCCNSAGNPRGIMRAKIDPVRRAAREARAAEYYAVCATHGTVPHSTALGKCLTCFDSAGRPRRPRRAPSARAASRAAGLTAFIDTCAVHGVWPHSVAHGKCLKCFTTAGAIRVHQT